MSFCPTCSRSVPEFANGPGDRPKARCPLCQALERHRFLAILLQAFHDEISRSRRILEIAPTATITRLLRSMSSGLYVGLDIDPNADGRTVQVVADLTAAPFREGAFDASICFHVFEHIPDDETAMAQYAQLISKRGIGFIQNPWRRHGPTQEDPLAPVEERIERFGQADHVRIYGEDFETRLGDAGLRVHRVYPDDLLDSIHMEYMGLRSHPIWIAHGPGSRLARMNDRRYLAKLRKKVERVLTYAVSTE